MASVQTNIMIEAPAEDVWNTVRAFGNIDQYVAAVDSVESTGEGVGMTRVLTLEDGASIKERLDARDDERRTLRYTIVEGPLPVENYVSTMSVRPIGEQQCEAAWHCTFDPAGAPVEEVKPNLEALYTAGLQGLQAIHGSKAR